MKRSARWTRIRVRPEMTFDGRTIRPTVPAEVCRLPTRPIHLPVNSRRTLSPSIGHRAAPGRWTDGHELFRYRRVTVPRTRTNSGRTITGTSDGQTCPRQHRSPPERQAFAERRRTIRNWSRFLAELVISSLRVTHN